MKTIGFVISHKNNERRRAILPTDLEHLLNNNSIYIEEGYGKLLGIRDTEYEKHGANIVSRNKVLQSDVIVDVKLGDADYLSDLAEEKILVGWAHAVQNIEFTDEILKNNHTVIAWEEMFDDGRYIYYRNREVAGEAAILQAYQYVGKMPYETDVAIIGNGMTAKGALRVLHGLGAKVDVYGRRLEHLFKKNLAQYDVLVNCVLWDTNRTDRLIYREDLKRLRDGTMIIDISCDPNLEIETSRPTTIDNPVYTIDGVIHYAVDNTPAMFPITVTNDISKAFSEYIDELIQDNWSQCLKEALVIENGQIVDEDIRKFRESRGVFVK